MVLVLQIFPRPAVVAPSSDGPAFARMVLRRLVKEVFLLCASDIRGELVQLVLKYAFVRLEHRTYCTILFRMFERKPSVLCLRCCETNLNKNRTYCDCLSINLYVPTLAGRSGYLNMLYRATSRSQSLLVSRTTFSNSSKHIRL